MNISVVISAILIAQVSASFFDVFQGAVLSVQNSVGKLISDVAYDVRETVDCTILAVEHVLSLSDDATSRYYEKCGSGKNKTDSVNNAVHEGGVPMVEVSVEISNNEEYLRKEIPVEIDAKINETLKKVLGSYDPHENLLSVQNVLAKETEQLADVSSLVKQELEKLHENEINSDFKNSRKNESEPSIDTILQEIKLLENREKITKNNSEANEIHNVIDKVLDKLDVIEATEATENLKLEEILKGLENNSNNTFVGLRQQFEEWKEEESRNLDEIKNKMEEHEKNAKHSKHNRNYTRPVELIEKRPNIDNKSSKMKGKSFLYPEVDQEASKDNNSGDISFKVIPNSTENIMAVSPTNMYASTNNEKDISEPSLKTQDKDMLYSTKSIMADKNKESTILTTIAPNVLNESVIVNIPFAITESLSKSMMTQPTESSMASKNDESSTLTTNESTTTENMLNVHDSDDNAISSIPLPITRSESDSEIIHTIENTTDYVKGEIPTLTTNKPTSPDTIDDSDLNDTVIPGTANENEAQLPLTTQTSLNDDIINDTVVASTAYAVDPTENTTYSRNGGSSITTPELQKHASVPTIFNNNDLNDTAVRDTISSEIMLTTIVNDIQSLESTTVSGNEESSLSKLNYDPNDIITTSTLFPIKSSIAVIENTQRIETTTVSGNEESSTLTINKFTNTPNVSIDDNSNDIMINSKSSPTKDTVAAIETIQPIATTNVSENVEPSSLITNKSINTPNIEMDDDSNDTMVISTTTPIKSKIAVTGANELFETTTISGNEEASNTGNEDDSNDTMITNTSSPIQVTTAVIEIAQPIETAYVSGNEKRSILTTNKPTSPNTVIVTTTDSDIDKQEKGTTATGYVDLSVLYIDPPNSPRNTFQDTSYGTNSTSFPTTESTLVSETIQSVERTPTTENVSATITNKVNEDYSNNTVTSTTFPFTDSALVNRTSEPVETTTVSITQESLSLTQSMKSIQTIIPSEISQIPLHEPEINDTVMAGTLLTTTTDKETIPLVNNPTTPTSRELTTLVTGQDMTTEKFINNQDLNKIIVTKSPRFTTESPIVNKNIPLLDRPVIPDNREWLTPTRKKAPNIFNQQDYSPNGLDSKINRVQHNEPPYNVPNSNPASTMPAMDVYAPSRPPTYPEKSSYTESPNEIIAPPYSFNGPLANMNRLPMGLTTIKPLTTASRKGNNAPLDLNSFFNIPHKNSDAHERAIREARELIENSKRSERIINSILNNRNKFGRRSIFNNPRTLNAGK